MTEPSTSFGLAASDYEIGRPSYPSDAVACLLGSARPTNPGEQIKILDVGAGTGKLTRAIIAAGHQPVALDPDPVMLAKLAEAMPEVQALRGHAEKIPAPDASFDAAVAGQSWHWVQPAAASTEIGRVVRPGGILGLIWNIRDTRADWVAEMSRIMHNSRAEEYVETQVPEVREPFGPLASETFDWARPMTRADLTAMVRSRSYLITADPETRASVERQLGGLFTDLGLHDDVTIELPYVTHAFTATRDR